MVAAAVVVVVVVVLLPLVVVVRLQSIRDVAKASRSFSSGSTRECMLTNIDLRKNDGDDSPGLSGSDVVCTSRVCARVILLMDT